MARAGSLTLTPALTLALTLTLTLALSLTLALTLALTLSTQENRSGCAAQRVGGRLVVSRHITPYRRDPLASTCVATDSPVIPPSGAGDGIRTRDNLLGKQELYH